MAVTQVVAFLFSFCLIITKGSDAKQLFVQSGSDVTLDIMDPDALKEDYLVLQWKFNSNILVSAPKNRQAKINNVRVVYHSQNSSLTVNNLQKEHSGPYQAVLITDTGTPTISSYSNTVQDPVSPVNLSVVPGLNSSEFCNFTVSCTTESSSISRYVTCNRKTCEEPHPLTPDSAPSLQLYLSIPSIICNHSNHVSWKNAIKEIKEVCPLFGSKDPPEKENQTDLTPVFATVGAVLVLLILAGAILCWKRQKKGRMEVEDTIYADPVGPSPQPAPVTEMMENPTSTYSLVGQHSGPAPTCAPDQIPESLYATVNKPQNNPYSLSP